MPSLKENKRYLLLENANKDDVEKALLDYLGVLGYAKIGLIFVKKDIIGVNREQITKVRAALCLYSKPIKIISVSGTLKGLKKQKFKK